MAYYWTELFTSFTPSGTGWQNYDIYTQKSVPKGAIAYIVCASVNDAAARTVGVRTDGSSLNRYVKLHEGEAGGAVCTSMHVKVDSSTGYIETYADNTTGITFYLMGYWTGIDFTETWDIWSPPTASTWTSVSTTASAASRVAEIITGNRQDGAAVTMGIRAVGSSLTRSSAHHEAESASIEATDYTVYTWRVKLDSSSRYQYWTSSTTTVDIIEAGYFGSDMDYVELYTTIDSSATGWNDFDLTSSIDMDGRVVDVLCGNPVTGVEHDQGARKYGSSDNRYILIHESEANGNNGYTVPTETDSSGIIQYYTGTTSEYARVIGYFKNVAIKPISKTSDARLKKTVDVFTKTSDARLAVGSSTNSTSKTSDARLKQEANAVSSKTSDARLLKVTTTTIPSDARLKATRNIGGTGGYSYKARVPVNYSSDGAQSNYQMKLTIYSGSGTNSAGVIYLNSHSLNWPYDIQFRNSSGTELSYWRESYDGTSATVWVECDSIASSGTTDFYIYYGKSAGTDGSDGPNTFLFFDHFTSLDTTNVWDQTGGSNATIVDSTWVKFASNGSTTQEIRTKNTVVSQNQAVSIEMSMNCVDINSDAGGGYSSGVYPLMLDSSNAGKDGLNWYKEAGYDRYVITNGSGTFRNATAGLADGYNIRQTWQIFTGTQKHITSGSLSLNDSWSGTTYLGSGAYKLKLGGPATSYVNDVRLDWVFIRKLTTNVPTWATPDSESTGDASGITANAKLTLVTYTTYDLSKYSDARLKQEAKGTSKPSDARLNKTVDVFTKFSDARLKKTVDVFSKPSDARLKKESNNVSSKTSDARLKKEANNVSSKTSDARLKKTVDVFTKTSNAKLSLLVTSTKYADARLLKVWTATKPSDARLKKEANAVSSKTSDARLKKTVDVFTKTSDARLKKEANSTSKISDAKLSKVTTLTKTSDARLKKEAIGITKTSDAKLSSGNNIYILSDARLKQEAKGITKTSDAKLRLNVTLTKSSDARLKQEGIALSKSSNARLVKVWTTSKTSDARLSKLTTVTKYSDAKLVFVGAISKTSDARLFQQGKTITKTSDARLTTGGMGLAKTSDARLKQEGKGLSKTSDARLVKVWTTTKYSDARLAQTWTTTKTSDGRLRITVGTTKTSDAKLLKVTTITKTSNARFIYSNSITKPSDARLKVTSSFSVPSDARLFTVSKTSVQVIIIGC